MDIRQQVLLALLRRRGQSVSGQALAQQLGLSRTAIWKHISALRENGIAIEGRQRGGYALADIPDTLDEAVLRCFLPSGELGAQVHLLAQVDSTNLYARKLAAQDAPHGTLVVADAQTAGRGRRGRHWVSEPGAGLWMSVLLRPQIEISQAQLLTLLCAAALCEALAQLCDAPLVIKWPNDILARGGKLCGILCEMQSGMDGVEYIVLGIGVNLREPAQGYPPQAGQAIALARLCPQPPARLELAAAVLQQMQDLLDVWQAQGFPAVARRYRRFMPPAGLPVTVHDPQTPYIATLDALDDDGALRLRLPDGTCKRIISGEISIRGDYHDL